MRTTLDKLSFEVMNATADDWESLEQIMSAVEKYAGDTGRLAVARLIFDLVSEGLFEVGQNKSVTPELIVKDPLEYWFRMTTQGRALWDAEAHKYYPDEK